MDPEFEQFVKREKLYRRKVLIIGIVLMSLGAFFIYIDWTIIGSIPLILGLLFIIGLFHNGATKEVYLKKKNLEKKQAEEKTNLENVELQIMDLEFEQFKKKQKKSREGLITIGIFFLAIGAFLIYIDWVIIGSSQICIGLFFLYGLFAVSASKEAFHKHKSLEQKKNEEKTKLEKAEKDKKNTAKLLEKQRLQMVEETIKIIDSNLNKLISIDFPKPISFKSNITDNEQTIIEKSGVDVIQKFVRISTFLNDAHRNLENVRENMREEFDPKQLLEDVKWRIEEEKNPSLDDLSEKLGRLASGDYRDTSADGLLKELLKFSNKLVPVFSKEIAQVAYLEAMANSMLIFLLNNKQILFYEILEVFDKIGALDSSWQKMISYKMDRIENKLDLLNGSLLDLNDKLDGLLDKNEVIINSLDSVDSSIKTNNLLQAITAYQTYRINKKTKRLD
jgi:hypothetical protein